LALAGNEIFRECFDETILFFIFCKGVGPIVKVSACYPKDIAPPRARFKGTVGLRLFTREGPIILRSKLQKVIKIHT